MSQVARLYPDFHPEAYVVQLRPDFNNWSFTGVVRIKGTYQGADGAITLHANGLQISGASIDGQSLEFELKPKQQHLVLKPADTLPADPVTIEITFSGVITDTMHGLYRSRFWHNDQEQHLLATQFEAIHAREVFPCIDEPEAKAIFTLSLTIPKNLTAISNTPIAQQSHDGQEATVTFEPSPKMSTYLLAFVVGELQHRRRTTDHGVDVGVYATGENIAYTEFALDVAVRVLDFFDEYFDIPYPLPKADLVAIPDFASGAMENWGCVTFREVLLLVDKNNTSLDMQQNVALVIAHELAHQWFGNLTTMRWWTDLWLNEGFASWIEYLAVDQLFPEWQVWDSFIAEDKTVALGLDSLGHSHSVEVPVRDPAEIDEIFDAISYEKGASVIHMLHQYLGAETFRQGLSQYLQKHSYSNTETTDLWQALGEASGADVVAFMSAWTQTTGYPLIQLDIEQGTYRLTQHRFLLESQTNSTSFSTWPVPVAPAGDDSPFILQDADSSWPFKTQPPLKLNAGQNGFYRVRYPADDLQQLAQQISEFQPLDRLGLLDDTFELAKAGYLPTTDAIQLLKQYHQEENHNVWHIIYTNVTALQRVFGEGVPSSEFGQTLLAPQLDRLGRDPIPQESHFDRLLRPTILALAGRMQEPATIADAKQRFYGSDTIHPDLRRIVYTIAARHGSKPEYEQLLKSYQATDMAEEKTRLANALCWFTQPELIRRSLGLIPTETVRKQEVGHWLSFCFANPYAKDIAWEWLQDNWPWIKDNFKNSHLWARLPKIVAHNYTDLDMEQALEQFFRDEIPQRSLEQAKETIRIQHAWQQRDRVDVKRFFSL